MRDMTPNPAFNADAPPADFFGGPRPPVPAGRRLTSTLGRDPSQGIA